MQNKSQNWISYPTSTTRQCNQTPEVNVGKLSVNVFVTKCRNQRAAVTNQPAGECTYANYTIKYTTSVTWSGPLSLISIGVDNKRKSELQNTDKNRLMSQFQTSKSDWEFWTFNGLIGT